MKHAHFEYQVQDGKGRWFMACGFEFAVEAQRYAEKDTQAPSRVVDWHAHQVIWHDRFRGAGGVEND